MFFPKINFSWSQARCLVQVFYSLFQVYLPICTCGRYLTTALLDRANFSYKMLFFQQSSPLAVHFCQWRTRACMLYSKIFMAIWNMVCLSCCLQPPLKCIPHSLTVLTSTVWSPSMFSKCQWMPFFSARRNSILHLYFIRISMSDAFCQTTLLLPSVTWQQTVMRYWWLDWTSTAISPTPASDIMGQHNNVRGITSRAAHICNSDKSYNWQSLVLKNVSFAALLLYHDICFTG